MFSFLTRKRKPLGVDRKWQIDTLPKEEKKLGFLRNSDFFLHLLHNSPNKKNIKTERLGEGVVWVTGYLHRWFPSSVVFDFSVLPNSVHVIFNLISWKLHIKIKTFFFWQQKPKTKEALWKKEGHWIFISRIKIKNDVSTLAMSQWQSVKLVSVCSSKPVTTTPHQPLIPIFLFSFFFFLGIKKKKIKYIGEWRSIPEYTCTVHFISFRCICGSDKSLLG